MKPILILTIIIAALSVKATSAQSPFDYGKGKDIYFMSAKERKELKIDNIYAIYNYPKSEMGGWIFGNTSFTDSVVSDYSADFPFDSALVPAIDTFIKPVAIGDDDSRFSNSKSYLLSKGKLSGMLGTYFHGGDGTGIIYKKDYTISSYSDYAHEGYNETHIFVYYPNGFIKYKFPVYDSLLETANDSLLPDNFKNLSSAFNIQFRDTIKYIYNKDWRITGTAMGNRVKPIFEGINEINPNETQFQPGLKYHQCYINKTEFESFIDKKIGYRPKFIIIEVCQNVVYTFIYNSKDNKYYRQPDICLECIEN